jgi:hypothetical protein
MSGTVALACFFAPKVYIVLWQPYKNVRTRNSAVGKLVNQQMRFIRYTYRSFFLYLHSLIAFLAVTHCIFNWFSLLNCAWPPKFTYFLFSQMTTPQTSHPPTRMGLEISTNCTTSGIDGSNNVLSSCKLRIFCALVHLCCAVWHSCFWAN